MKFLTTLLFLLLFSFSVHAASVGVAPSKLAFGTVEKDQEYHHEVTLINPNDFGVKYSIMAPKGIDVEPASGLIGPGQTRRQELTFTFSDAEEDILLVEMRRMTPRDEGALGMVPAVAVKLEYSMKWMKKAKITGAATTEIIEEGKKLEIFKGEKDRMWLLELAGVIVVVLAILGYLGYSYWKGRKKPKEAQKTLKNI